jgi:hypothetical protein
MANMIRNYNLELPVFGPETPVAWTSWDIQHAARQEREFVRRIMFHSEPPYYGNLKRGLALGNLILANTADYLQTDIIEYQWGLYDGQCPEKDRNTHIDSSSRVIDCVPEGYSLVAQVESVQNKRPLNSKDLDILNLNLRNYTAGLPNSRYMTMTQCIRDIRASHFVATYAGLQPAERLTLVDIDLHISRTPYFTG